ncbi:MAG: GlsB/YeaQ/YmgE family stress response membrane protein [Anaerolineae bacterium]|nr:GlsB/YeaQ/YmgE family stress response membrane protein [Anaerolineae bacterium]
MNISLGQVIVWLIVGALAGSLAGMIVTRRRKGYGPLTNIVLGLIGAVIGGFLFKLLNINLGLGEIAISFDDLVAAFVGSLILLGIVALLMRRG